MILQTRRLALRRLHPGDAAFILELVNDPDWLRFIGDRGVRTEDDARRYIRGGPQAMYERHGFGLFCLARLEDGVSIGICGLLRREGLDDVDLGFALLPAFRAHGYAYEAAAGTVAYARETLGLPRLAAITTPDNHASIRLLEKLGMRFEGPVQLPGDPEELSLYRMELTDG
jgi:RimJ/RimL family protein N-acetyltransferase